MLYNGSHSPEFVDSTLLILNEIAVSDLGHYGSDEKRRLGFSAGIQTKRAIELSLAEPFQIIHLVAEQLQRLDIRYYVGGSLASSYYGIPRATQDIDIIAAVKTAQVTPLVRAFEQGFYVDEGMIRESIRNQSSFNMIHLETMFKVDVFVWKNEPFSVEEMARRKAWRIPDQSDRQLYFASAEDTILQKLNWYRLGGETSERQWHDIIGVIKVQSENLDRQYLNKWAKSLGLSDLLAKAYKDTEPSNTP